MPKSRYSKFSSFFAAVLFCAIFSLQVHAAGENSTGPSRQESLRQIWERYSPEREQFQGTPLELPGRLVGNSPELRAFAAASHWTWRGVSYELYFASAPELARAIYGLALDSGDVPADMPLERFERAVQGFHYSLAQVCHWANKVLRDQMRTHTVEERVLFDWLLVDGVINIKSGSVFPSEIIRHVLGAAGGAKRSFRTNLIHERMHIIWDEDRAFKAEALARWQGQSATEKEAAFASLPGYNRNNEPQLVEEWAVKAAEKLPVPQREKLVGL